MLNSVVSKLHKAFQNIRILLKWLLFPGFDLHTRCRYRFLTSYFKSGPIDTLDAGFGNGALAYAAYKLGNNVLGVSFDPEQIRKADALFSKVIKDNSNRLQFQLCNLYDLPKLDRNFDQIICSETLEHIKDDKRIIKYFYDILNRGGVLHLCCPYALHPHHHLGRVDGLEDGGHVRDGYTLESYESLLKPAGFKIVKSVGLGTSLLVDLDQVVRGVTNKYGEICSLPLFVLTWPLQFLDKINPKVPFSIYVQAIK